ncbi:uncharacterized protein LOC132186599 [Corylus avellana]|uniref:uncharacterized protein LOC132186599 n=1 Tax=Corylus avellana TaxID=13451 RepID=UPI00286B0C4E|nr:uncharacterized protein LOC132186599 [Corylus avellana]
MDLSSGSEDEVYGGRYSVLSSPQDDEKQVNSGDDKIQLKRGHGNPVELPGYTEEFLDSATSTEVSFTQSRSNTCTLDGCSPSVTLRANVEITAKQDSYGSGLLNKKLSNNNIPSAPPFVGSETEVDQILTRKAHGTSCLANPSGSATTKESRSTTSSGIYNQSARSASVFEAHASPIPSPARLPTFHASGQGIWSAVVSYDACCRLCLHSWARGHCMEAPYFLNDECVVLREAFGLRQVLLQSEEELLARRSPELVSEVAAPKSRKTLGKMKMQLEVCKLKMESFHSHSHLSKFKSKLFSEWEAFHKVRVATRTLAKGSSGQFMKKVSGLLKFDNSSTHDVVPERYSCLLRLKSSFEEDAVRMQPGSRETHVFFPDSLGDDLIIEVQDSKGQYKGRVLAQVASIADDPGNKLRWWPIYHEPEHEVVGRVQLSISYSTTPVENNHLKCSSIAETVAYDFVLEVAMKVQHIKQRNLLLHSQWKWLVTTFASLYGVSDAYTKLRYLTHVMDVATPTDDCLALVHDLLLPVIMKSKSKGKSDLSHQENRMLGVIEDKVQQIITLVFENYKSLDESLPSGMTDVLKPATEMVAPVLVSALKLFSLLHDILSPEAQLKLCRYFQAASKKRARWHLIETNELILSSDKSTLMDPVTVSTYYHKMKSLICNIRNEIFADIEIHNQHVLPSFIDLPNISSAIYCGELCRRLRAFLVAYPPPSLSPPVAELVIATADFQRDLACWNTNPAKGGVDAKELFQEYINIWIQEMRLTLLGLCKLDKANWSGVRNQHSTNAFVEDMYDRLKEMMDEYEVIIFRWPEYIHHLEKAIADIEKAIVEGLDRQYADVLTPLKDNLTSKIYGLKYVQKIAKRSDTYVIPDELGNILNSMRRMLEILRPEIETKLNSWSSCIPNFRDTTGEDCLSEVTVMLRAKFRSYLHAIVEKLAKNMRLQRETKLKHIIQALSENVEESDVKSRMQPLEDMLIWTMDHLHTIVEPHVLIAICRGFWDRMGQDILHSIENRRESKSYKGLRFSVSILDGVFVREMQKLLGNALQEKDLEPPPNVREVHSLLYKNA